MQGPKSIKPTILYNESKHSIFAMVGKVNKPSSTKFSHTFGSIRKFDLNMSC